MSGATGPEHWLDRIAERQSRRQILKSALLGAALTMPLVRSLPAAAVLAGCDVGKGPRGDSCWKGCVATANGHFAAAKAKCDSGPIGPGSTYTGTALTFLAPFYGFLGFVVANEKDKADLAAYQKCSDTAMLTLKATAYECYQPFCPDWNPCDPAGPCDFCLKGGGICCPDPNAKDGYSCCTKPPGGCCKPDGCHSGTSECSG